MTPLYPIILVGIGAVFGRHVYFRHFAVRMFSRFGIPPELLDKNFAENPRHFKSGWSVWHWSGDGGACLGMGGAGVVMGGGCVEGESSNDEGRTNLFNV
jgi:hypothetical protein